MADLYSLVTSMAHIVRHCVVNKGGTQIDPADASFVGCSRSQGASPDKWEDQWTISKTFRRELEDAITASRTSAGLVRFAEVVGENTSVSTVSDLIQAPLQVGQGPLVCFLFCGFGYFPLGLPAGFPCLSALYEGLCS